MNKILPILCVIAIIVTAGIVGCRKQEVTDSRTTRTGVEGTEIIEDPGVIEEVVEEAEVVREEAAPVTGEDPEAFYEGFVTFLSGEAEIMHEPEPDWLLLDVDDSVFGRDRVKTGLESYCEVQFTEFGIIRIQQQTEVLMKSVFLKEEKNKVRLKLDKGNVLCKIDKLAKDEEFQVETGTVLAGVRGTEFMVRETSGGKTVIAVNEGAVEVVPSKIAERVEAIEADLQTDTAREVLREVTTPEIVVTDKQEVVIEAKQVETAVKQFEEASPDIEKKIRKIDEKAAAVEEKEQLLKSKPEEQTAKNLREVEEMKDEIQELKEDMATSTKPVNEEIQEIVEQVDRVSRSSQRELNDIKAMQRRDFVIAAKMVEKKDKQKPKGPVYSRVTIQVEPKNARIVVDGKDSGRGKFSGLYESGSRLRVAVMLQGYKTAQRTITVPELDRQQYYIKLESPIVWRHREEGDYFVRKPALTNDRIVLASSRGELLCLGTEGDVIWSVSTDNRPNENSMPVLSEQMVLFSGGAEFVAVLVGSGEVVKRMKLQKDEYPGHIFGSPAVPFGPSILFPATDRLLLFNARNMSQERSIPVLESGLGSPAAYGKHLVMVNENGELLVLDPADGSVKERLDTGAFQMMGASPSIVGDRAVFGDNSGTIVLADLSEPQVVWEKRIGAEGTGASAVYQDIVVGKDAVYPYTGEAFHPLSLADGEKLFGSVRSTCNPLYHEGMLVYGDPDSSLVMMNARTGKILTRYRLDSPVTLMPAYHGKNLVVATRSGTVYMIEAEHL
jgi:outer membrane protein assembly factor BamB